MGGAIYGMIKTTVYLPEDLEARLDSESTTTGCSKAERIRRAIAMLLDSSNRPVQAGPIPVFDSGRELNADAMDAAVYEHIKERAARR